MTNSNSTNSQEENKPYKGQLFVSVDGTEYTCKELVHIVRSYYKARDTILYYAGIAYDDLIREWENHMHRARETLEEIEDDRQS